MTVAPLMYTPHVAGYKANLAAAGESDGRLEQRLQQNSSAFSALSLDNAVAAMPRLQVRVISTTLLPRARGYKPSAHTSRWRGEAYVICRGSR